MVCVCESGCRGVVMRLARFERGHRWSAGSEYQIDLGRWVVERENGRLLADGPSVESQGCWMARAQLAKPRRESLVPTQLLPHHYCRPTVASVCFRRVPGYYLPYLPLSAAYLMLTIPTMSV